MLKKKKKQRHSFQAAVAQRKATRWEPPGQAAMAAGQWAHQAEGILDSPRGVWPCSLWCLGLHQYPVIPTF